MKIYLSQRREEREGKEKERTPVPGPETPTAGVVGEGGRGERKGSPRVSRRKKREGEKGAKPVTR